MLPVFWRMEIGMTVRTLKDLSENPISGVYTMVGSFNRIVYRVWYKGEWYPEVFTSAKNAEIQFEALKERGRNVAFGIIFSSLIVVAVLFTIIVIVRYWQ
jgi:hypothetical protein